MATVEGWPPVVDLALRIWVELVVKLVCLGEVVFNWYFIGIGYKSIFRLFLFTGFGLAEFTVCWLDLLMIEPCLEVLELPRLSEELIKLDLVTVFTSPALRAGVLLIRSIESLSLFYRSLLIFD